MRQKLQKNTSRLPVIEVTISKEDFRKYRAPYSFDADHKLIINLAKSVDMNKLHIPIIVGRIAHYILKDHGLFLGYYPPLDDFFSTKTDQ